MSNLDKQIIIFQYSTHLFNITLLVFFVHSDTEKLQVKFKHQDKFVSKG